MHLSKAVIAIVDDEERVREALEDLLQANFYEVRCFGSGEDFLASGVLMRSDCLITDIHMNGVSGWDLLSIARVERPDMPVILITGRSRDAAELMQHRGQRFLFEKPVDGRDILKAISVVLTGDVAP